VARSSASSIRAAWPPSPVRIETRKGPARAGAVQEMRVVAGETATVALHTADAGQGCLMARL
jgi:hypothetical protein